MNQQINLYQPIFREERKLFSLKTAAIALAMVAVGLTAIWALGATNVARLQHSVDQLKQQLTSQERMAQSAGILLGGQGNPVDVQTQVQQMSARLAERTRALDLLRNGAAGAPRGFAPRLSALARQHTEGIWLDHLYLGGAGTGVALQGRSINADLVPKYLQSLTAEPELAGSRFDEVVLDRREHEEDDRSQVAPLVAAEPSATTRRTEKEKRDAENTATVRFSVSSSALLKTMREKRPEHKQ